MAYCFSRDRHILLQYLHENYVNYNYYYYKKKTKKKTRTRIRKLSDSVYLRSSR